MNITLKDLPAELHDRLKAAAEESGRSLNRQIIVTLEQVLLPKRIERGLLIERIQKRREWVGDCLDPMTLEDTIEEDRP